MSGQSYYIAHALFKVISIEEQERRVEAIDQEPWDRLCVGVFAYVGESIDARNLPKDRVVWARSAPYEKNEAQDHS